MNTLLKHQLYDVEFAAKITVSAVNAADAVRLARELLDCPHAYPTYIHVSQFTYPPPLDLSQLDQPSGVGSIMNWNDANDPIQRPAPDIDTDPVPFYPF